MESSITMEAWLKQRKPKVKGSSLKTYKSYEQAHILPFMGSVPLTEITAKKQRKFKKWLRKSLARKTVRDILAYLHSILREAEKKGIKVSAQTPKIKVYPKEKKVPGYGEHKALSAALQKSQAPQDMGILLAMSTGLRLGEVLGLRLKDIDFETNVLHVRRNRQRVCNPKTGKHSVVLQSPKTKASRRDIPIHTELKTALIRYLETQRKTDPKQPLIAAPSGRAYDARTLQRRFDQIKARMGLNPRITFHSLRHSFVTRALELGADMRAVSGFLGHSSVAFTLNCYSHCVTGYKRQQMALIAESF